MEERGSGVECCTKTHGIEQCGEFPRDGIRFLGIPQLGQQSQQYPKTVGCLDMNYRPMRPDYILANSNKHTHIPRERETLGHKQTYIQYSRTRIGIRR